MRLSVAATRHPGETRAILKDENDTVLEVRLFRGTPESAEGALLRGRVVGTLAAARAVLVDVGGAAPGLLPLAEWPGAPEELTEGRAVAVGIERPARAEKGPRLTGRIRLATPRLIFSPFRAGVSVSHRLAAEDVRRLSAWAQSGAAEGEGWVARGAAAAFPAAVLDRDRERLRHRWAEARAAAAAGGPPACLVPAPDPFAEWLAEMAAEVASVAVSGGVLNHAARGVLVERVPLLASLGDPFAEEGGEEALEEALSPLVALPGGGRISLEPTRAFLAVDVDSGGDTAPEAARAVNDAAVDRLVRELRLRNVGGAVVVDAIPEARKGPTEAQRKRLPERLRAAAAGDPRIQVNGMTQLGHLELVRARRGLSLHDVVLGDTLGEGAAAAETTALAMLRDWVADARLGTPAHPQVNPAVAGWLSGPGRGAAAEAETMAGQKLSWRIAGDRA
ncbi:ribonuclease E/G [Oleispirillum naphthae]|uniref:ribonuclease E/G n=1 Tax=Oleispirillum naphthae TaxID=2838853 RepID=UPI0030822931